MKRPCLTCGEPSTTSHCEEHAPHQPWTPKTPPAERGYDQTWRNLSKRARRLQPFCTDCGSTEDLQCDHTPAAWKRKAAGKVIRLVDVDVVCGPCNVRRGAARPGGEGRHNARPTPTGKSQSQFDTGGMYP